MVIFESTVENMVSVLKAVKASNNPTRRVIIGSFFPRAWNPKQKFSSVIDAPKGTLNRRRLRNLGC